MITYTELHKILMYNPWTGDFYWKIKTANCVQIGCVAGCSDTYGYIIITIKGKPYKAHRLAWLYVYGYLPEKIVEHKNQVKHNNWINNLREASQQCNMRNIGNFSHNTSGVKGVCWIKNNNKWRASLQVNRQSKILGQFKSFDEAVCHRLAGEQCVNWEGCDSCSPAFQYVKNNIQKGEV